MTGSEGYVLAMASVPVNYLQSVPTSGVNDSTLPVQLVIETALGTVVPILSYGRNACSLWTFKASEWIVSYEPAQTLTLI